MRLVLKLAYSMAVATWSILWAQDLSPRAYIITPLHSNAVTLTYSFYSGSILFSGAAPITGATGTYSVPIAVYSHSFNFFGRSANVNASLPYGVGTFQGNVIGSEEQIYRSGLLDFGSRISVNLKGGPAMPVREYAKWKQKTLLGVSLRVVAPTGQYSSTKLVNWGANRWGFRPEFGYSRLVGKWLFDGYAGAWFYTTNPNYYSPLGNSTEWQRPIGSFETHLSYDVKPRLWFSLDGNFWFGGLSSVNGVPNLDTRQVSSRIGATGSIPIGKHQSIKVAYNNGAYTRYGNSLQSVSVAWQYSWLGRPR
jgi:hypothetical protein